MALLGLTVVVLAPRAACKRNLEVWDAVADKSIGNWRGPNSMPSILGLVRGNFNSMIPYSLGLAPSVGPLAGSASILCLHNTGEKCNDIMNK